MKTIFLLPFLITLSSCVSCTKEGEEEARRQVGAVIDSIFEELKEQIRGKKERILCPDGFIVAPALEGYTEKDFCVAKYEMKNTEGAAISSPLERPWANINRLEAQEKCREMGEGYDLISNGQWQTLARNIEMVKSNWKKSSLLKDGHLAHGHSDGSPAITLAASSDDENGLFETGNTFEEGSSWHSQRRTLTLSNGEVIWDLAGNVWEWARDDNHTTYGQDMPIAKLSTEGVPSISNSKNSTAPVLENNTKGEEDAPIAKTASAANSDGLPDSTVPTSPTPKERFGPIGDYSSGSYAGLGMAYVNHSGGGIRRGSSWNAFWGGPGIFSVALIAGPKSRSRTVGFRCVYHPR